MADNFIKLFGKDCLNTYSDNKGMYYTDEQWKDITQNDAGEKPATGASSIRYNTAIRQLFFMASILGEALADATAVDTSDDTQINDTDVTTGNDEDGTKITDYQPKLVSKLKALLASEKNITNNKIAENTIQNSKLKEGTITTEKINTLSFLNLIYPVGSIYMSISNVNPFIELGTTWERLTDCYLYAAGDSDTNIGTAQGTKDFKISTEMLPSHSHSLNDHTHTLEHNHQGTAQTTSLTGWFEILEGAAGKNGGGDDSIPTVGGIVSKTDNYWDRDFLKTVDNNIKSTKIDINASHGHTLSINKNTDKTTSSPSTTDTGNTGSGNVYKPGYIPVYVWKRTE